MVGGRLWGRAHKRGTILHHITSPHITTQQRTQPWSQNSYATTVKHCIHVHWRNNVVPEKSTNHRSPNRLLRIAVPRWCSRRRRSAALPATPANILLRMLRTTSAEVVWKADDARDVITKFRLFLQPTVTSSREPPLTSEVRGSQRHYVFNYLTPNVKYRITIASFCDHSEGNMSEALVFTTMAGETDARGTDARSTDVRSTDIRSTDVGGTWDGRTEHGRTGHGRTGHVRRTGGAYDWRTGHGRTGNARTYGVRGTGERGTRLLQNIRLI